MGMFDDEKWTLWDKIEIKFYRVRMFFVEVKWWPRKLKVALRNFKFGWQHPYSFDKINSIENFVWMEFCDYMEKYGKTVEWRANRVIESDEPDDHWKEPSKELLALYRWYKTGKQAEEHETDKLFEISENLNKPKFEKVPGNEKYSQLVYNYDRPGFTDSERAAMIDSRDKWIEAYRACEKRYEDNTNRLFQLRGFLWD